MRGSKAHVWHSVHMVEKMENSVGRRFVWGRCRADKQSSQEEVAAAAVVAVAVVVERRTESGQELRTQKMAWAAEGSVSCKEETERSSKRGDLAVAPVLDLEDPCCRLSAQVATKNEIF